MTRSFTFTSRAALPAIAAVAAVALGCETPLAERVIPDGQLYFPTGLIYSPRSGDEAGGALFVASSNFDRRYDTGRLTGIDLNSLTCATAGATGCLPAFGTHTGAPLDITSLGTIDEKALASLAGEMDGVRLGDGTFRLLIPSRAEDSLLQVVDTTGERITCKGEGATAETEDCSVGAIGLEANRLASNSKPRAPAPFSVSIDQTSGEAFVTSLQHADFPAASFQNLEAFTVRLNAFTPEVSYIACESAPQGAGCFLSLGTTPTVSVVMGHRHAFMSGAQGQSLRLIDRTNLRLFDALVENNFNLIDARGLALAPDESAVYLLARRPDALLVLQARNLDTGTPLITLSHSELLPLGASQVKAMAKPNGSGNVAFISCVGTQTYDAVGSSQGALLVWDDAAGRIVAELNGFGFQPYGLAVQRIGNGARVYAGLFGEGRIAVADMPDLNRPEDFHLVARLGTSHVCVVNPDARGCTETTP